MEALVLLVVAGLSLALAVAGAAAFLWSVLTLMSVMQSRATAPLAEVVAEEIPTAVRVAA